MEREEEMENELIKNGSPTLFDCAMIYYSKGIVTIPIDLASNKPMIDLELFSDNDISQNELEKMFNGLNYDEHGIAIPVNSRFGHFEGIRFNGNSIEIDSVIDEFFYFLSKESPSLTKQIAMALNNSWTDFYFGMQKEGLTGKILAEKIDINGNRVKFMEFLGNDGFILVPPTNGYRQSRNYPFPSTISADERNLLIRGLRLFNIPNQYYMDSMDYGKKEKLANIVAEFHYHKDSEHVIRGTLINELKWFQITDNIWKKRNREGKMIYGFLNKEKKDRFWVSGKIDMFEPNVIYLPFDFIVQKNNGDYMKALEIACSKIPKFDFGELRRYKKTQKNLQEAYVPLLEEFIPPEPYIYTLENDEKYIIGSIHNLSVLSGKAKVGKTLLLNEITNSAFKDEKVFHYSEKILSKKIVYIDTEQSRNHSRLINERIKRTSNKERDYLASRFELFNVTNRSHEERIDVIEEKLYSDSDIAILIIDGIVDLVRNYNNPDEVSKLMTRLLKWKDENPVHIMVVIHENKGNSLLRGHLGTELMNKAETIIGVSKNNDVIKVKCKASRNKEFKPKAFKILDDGILEPIIGFSGKENENSIENLSQDEHLELLDIVFEGVEEMQYSELITNLKEALFIQHSISLGVDKVKKRITYYVDEGFLIKERRGFYTLNPELFDSGIQGDDEEKTT